MVIFFLSEYEWRMDRTSRDAVQFLSVVEMPVDF